MLLKQLQTWNSYSEDVQYAIDFIVVDDCSPEPAEPVIREYAYHNMARLSDPGFIQLYRIDKDIPWNRGMARNLGTKMATTPWVLHVDTDHVLPPESAEELVRRAQDHELHWGHWYRFSRLRIGAADETRKKDKVDPKATFVEIHPHIDSYLCGVPAFWKAGGYNTRFSGVLGGGSPFLKEMELANGEPIVLPEQLHVHTRHSVPDSSEHTLPRDPAAFKRRKIEIMKKYGTLRADPAEALPQPWHKVF